jgi:hypothetical protein
VKRGAPMARKPMRSSAKPTGPRRSVVELCLERAQYSCEVCSGEMGDERGTDWSVQHRIPRGMGGSRYRLELNQPPNLLITCGHATAGCNGIIEQHRTASYRAGWLLHRQATPALEPVLIEKGTRWVLLTADGGYLACPAPARGEL